MESLLFLKLLILLSTRGLLTLEPLSGKSGADQVREAVHQAEEAARKAAEDSAKHGDNSAELRVAAIREKLASQRAAKQRLHVKQNLNVTQSSLRKWEHPMRKLQNNTKQFANAKQHIKISPMSHHQMTNPAHRNSYSHMINLNDLTNGITQNTYKEDTALEDRLALEAEEEKKIGSQYDDDHDYSISRSLSNGDAAQSIQNQVAQESARELKEIQAQINAESQNSLGKTTMGDTFPMFQHSPSGSRQREQNAQAQNGFLNLQTDYSQASMNSEAMNNEPSSFNAEEGNAISPKLFSEIDAMGQSQEDLGSNPMATFSMPNLGQTEQMSDGGATMEGPQADMIQPATSTSATGADQRSVMSNNLEGLGRPAGYIMQGGYLGMNSDNGGLGMKQNVYGGGRMKKSEIEIIKEPF